MRTRMMLLAVVGMLLPTFTAKAYWFIEMVENSTVTELRAKGWERSERNPDMLNFVKISAAEMEKAGITPPAITKMTVQEATAQLHSVKYFLAKAMDYVVVPVVGAGATYGVGKALTSGKGNTETTTINAGGDVNTGGNGNGSNNGGNGSGGGSGHITKPTTQTTTTGTAARRH